MIFLLYIFRKLRNLNLDDASKFSADVNQVMQSNNVVDVPLSNKNGDNLILQISILENAKIRIEIAEPKSTRFKLKDGWALFQSPIAQA